MYNIIIDFAHNDVVLSAAIGKNLGDIIDFVFLINKEKGVLAITSDVELDNLNKIKRTGHRRNSRINRYYDETVDGY
ncbi:MAG: hypothetical protein IJ766_00175 [Clostridia bacterium]|nr:hypothetical protein [Clostridia bacterium]